MIVRVRSIIKCFGKLNMNKFLFSVSGKKGKIMERRILKDFQIGIVEGILNASLQNAKEPKDVFSTIAKVIGRRTSSKK